MWWRGGEEGLWDRGRKRLEAEREDQEVCLYVGVGGRENTMGGGGLPTWGTHNRRCVEQGVHEAE